MKRITLFSSGLIWFGAAVSVAEIEAGFLIGDSWLGLVCGHILGGVMLFFAGLLGAVTKKNAMETAVGTFGRGGMSIFALLNVVQLVGWTAVMIAQGGAMLSDISGISYFVFVIILTILVVVWIFVAFSDRFHLATLAVGLLTIFAICLMGRLLRRVDLCKSFGGGFWNAFEVSLAMPLSWLPLVSDYTSKAERPYFSSAVSALAYSCASIWMYLLGALFAKLGASSVVYGIKMVEFGFVGVMVVVFSTVTTTFLDAYSAGESASVVFKVISARPFSIFVCIVGGLIAATKIMDFYIDFLYLISSVFAPMATVLLVDCFVVRKSNVYWNMFSWFVGFVVYHFAILSPIAPSLTAIFVSAFLVMVLWWIRFLYGKLRKILR